MGQGAWRRSLEAIETTEITQMVLFTLEYIYPTQKNSKLISHFNFIQFFKFGQSQFVQKLSSDFEKLQQDLTTLQQFHSQTKTFRIHSTFNPISNFFFEMTFFSVLNRLTHN